MLQSSKGRDSLVWVKSQHFQQQLCSRLLHLRYHRLHWAGPSGGKGSTGQGYISRPVILWRQPNQAVGDRRTLVRRVLQVPSPWAEPAAILGLAERGLRIENLFLPRWSLTQRFCPTGQLQSFHRREAFDETSLQRYSQHSTCPQVLHMWTAEELRELGTRE